MGSRVGVEQAAAARIGYSLTEYLDNLNRGLLWCHKDQAWEPAEDFGVDRSRGRGRASSCRRSRNAASRARYAPKDRPTPGRRFVAARDDDRKQARRRVNYLIDAELLPAPSTLPCADCRIDLVLDSHGRDGWVLDESDYGDDGSSPP